jgi:hypothetical protein
MLTEEAPGKLASSFVDSEDEDSLPLVRSADFLRCEEARRKAITHFLKLSSDSLAEGTKKVAGQKSGDVFEEADERSALADRSDCLCPEPPVVALAFSLAGEAGGHAGGPSKDEMNLSTPRASVEGSCVRPDRSRMHGSFFHMRDKDACCKGLPFDVSHDPEGRQGDGEPKVETSDAGKQGDCIARAGEAGPFRNSLGTNSHILMTSRVHIW